MRMSRHALTFRGEDYTIPAGQGKCTRCGRLLAMEEWLTSECPIQAAEAAKEAHSED